MPRALLAGSGAHPHLVEVGIPHPTLLPPWARRFHSLGVQVARKAPMALGHNQELVWHKKKSFRVHIKTRCGHRKSPLKKEKKKIK